MKRIAINALIAFASLFTREKVINRIMFAEMDHVRQEVSNDSLPLYVGGGGGGKNTTEENIIWVKTRIQNFPDIPDF